MPPLNFLRGLSLAWFAAALAAIHAAPLTVRLVAPPPAESGYFKMGTARSPDGHELTLDSRSLRLRLAILPLRRNAPIFLAASAKPDFGAAPAVAALLRVELLQSTTVTLAAR